MSCKFYSIVLFSSNLCQNWIGNWQYCPLKFHTLCLSTECSTHVAGALYWMKWPLCTSTLLQSWKKYSPSSNQVYAMKYRGILRGHNILLKTLTSTVHLEGGQPYLRRYCPSNINLFEKLLSAFIYTMLVRSIAPLLWYVTPFKAPLLLPRGWIFFVWLLLLLYLNIWCLIFVFLKIKLLLLIMQI